jgi:signal transduction histidine kinase
MQGEKFAAREMLLKTPDGRQVPLLISAAPVYRRDGRLEGAVVVYEDISTLKEMQRLREEWAAIVAHDLRQPLSVITTQVSLLRRIAEDPNPKSFHKGLEQTQRAVHALSRMVDDLAEMSRIEAKCLDLDRQSIDLNVVARECVEHQRVVAPDRTIELFCAEHLPKVDADRDRIERVLGDLLANALKYSDPGTPIRVDVRRVDNEVRVAVTNRGPTISADELPKLFGLYYRTQRARASAARGLGLGLYIAKGVIEAHGGRIWAESCSGETTFQFALAARLEDVLH